MLTGPARCPLIRLSLGCTGKLTVILGLRFLLRGKGKPIEEEIKKHYSLRLGRKLFRLELV